MRIKPYLVSAVLLFLVQHLEVGFLPQFQLSTGLLLPGDGPLCVGLMPRDVEAV
jgi:hypothetical protein